MREGLTVREAQEWILGVTKPLSAETVSGFDALGRVLAEPISSERLIPPADVSAMDGYAVHGADLAQAGPDRPVSLPVAFEVAAGDPAERPLPPGSAARVFTGAPVPPGADAVVMQEKTRPGEAGVDFLVRPTPREHVRDAGEDMRPGELVLEAGRRVGPAQLGLLTALGRSVVAVHRRPRVAILSGGNELVEPDRAVDGGKIVSSNSYTLAAQCRAIGADPVYLGISVDDPASVEAQFRAALHADCIVSSAGVSVGDHDHVRPVLEKLGCTLEFWGVKMKPGFPLAFGRFGQDEGALPLVFGLPGNPVSASVTFEQFVRPALLKMLGHTRCFRGTLDARLAEAQHKKAGRLHFVRVCLERRDAEWWASSTGNQSSGVMRSMALADGLMIFPLEATELAAGEHVTVQVLDEHIHDGVEPGF